MVGALRTAVLLSLAAVVRCDFRVKFEVEVRSGTKEFTVLVHEDWAPIGAARFKELVEARFYDDTRFFRVIPGFMVQFGLSGDPAVSAAWRDRTIRDEPVEVSNKPGFTACDGPGLGLGLAGHRMVTQRMVTQHPRGPSTCAGLR